MRVGSTTIVSNDEGHILRESQRSPASTFVGTWQAERKPIQLMTRTKLQSHLSNIKYIANPDKMKMDSTTEDQVPLKHEANSVQLKEQKDGPSPSQPESRMGLSDTQSPLGSLPLSIESKEPLVDKDT
jgi:hypothetical protein